MASLNGEIDRVIAEHGFSGVIRIDRGGVTELEVAHGLADRAWEIPNHPGTRFGMASGSKSFTALAVVALIEAGQLRLDEPVREILGADLPLIDARVTVEHLLDHTSGIGDYLDEKDWSPTQHVMPVPVHTLARTEDFLAVLDGFPQVSPPGERYAYCNGGYVVLALIAERVAGVPFADLIDRHVLTPAGLTATAFLRMDSLPRDVARGYLAADGLRSNVLHLPVLATGDGGMFTDAADLVTFWRALFDGRVVSPLWLERMLERRSLDEEEGLHAGLGFYRHRTSAATVMVGMDAGVSFQSCHDPDQDLTWSVLSNGPAGAWQIVELLAERLDP